MQPVNSYIRTQGVTCAAINVVLNPVVAWLSNRQMDFMPLWGANGIVVDTAVTSIVLSLLVALFIASGVRRDLHAGHVAATEGFPRVGPLLSRLPSQAWALGLFLGLGMAFVLTPLTFGLFHVLGFSGLPFIGFALFKALYTGPLGFIVTRWVILRQLLSYCQS